MKSCAAAWWPKVAALRHNNSELLHKKTAEKDYSYSYKQGTQTKDFPTYLPV